MDPNREPGNQPGLFVFRDEAITVDQKPPSPVPQKVKPGKGDTSVAFSFNGTDVMFDDARLVNLTAMWRAGGSQDNKDPRQWRRKEGARFIKHMTTVLNVPVGHIIKAERGKGGATWAHWQIALAYAKYLSDEFHQFVNEAFKEWTEEKINPELKAARAYDAMKRKFGPEKASARWNGVPARKKFCAEIKKRSGPTEGKYIPYQALTNATYIAVTGKDASEIKAESGLPRSSPARDALSVAELAMTQYAEENIITVWGIKRSIGNKQCFEHALPVLDLIKDTQQKMAKLTGSNTS